MADPFLLIERGYLFLENDLINDAMQALYDPEIIIEDGRTTVTIRAIPDDDTIRNETITTQGKRGRPKKTVQTNQVGS
jgi:hypothetical protein